MTDVPSAQSGLGQTDKLVNTSHWVILMANRNTARVMVWQPLQSPDQSTWAANVLRMLQYWRFYSRLSPSSSHFDTSRAAKWGGGEGIDLGGSGESTGATAQTTWSPRFRICVKCRAQVSNPSAPSTGCSHWIIQERLNAFCSQQPGTKPHLDGMKTGSAGHQIFILLLIKPFVMAAAQTIP